MRFTLPTFLEARSNPKLSIYQSIVSIGQKYEKFRPEQGPKTTHVVNFIILVTPTTLHMGCGRVGTVPVVNVFKQILAVHVFKRV